VPEIDCITRDNEERIPTAISFGKDPLFQSELAIGLPLRSLNHRLNYNAPSRFTGLNWRLPEKYGAK
jgi:hypothetical protein